MLHHKLEFPEKVSFRKCFRPNMFLSFVSPVSGSNLASHMVGSLKKGSKQSMSLPSTAYNTLPAHVHNHMRSTTSSPRVISGSNKKSANHKRSPSSDSGTGSNGTPISSYHSTGKVHHTVYLHGKFCKQTFSYYGTLLS